MKKDTYLEKLNKMLGLETKAKEVKTKETEKRTGRIQGIPEETIQEFREVQGILYFLQAPALFTPKTCRHCGEGFLVSRRLVTCCSWHCMREEIKSYGYTWEKGQGIEFDEQKMLDLINDPQVFGGQEPIWVRNLDTLEVALQKLTEFSKSYQTTKSAQETLMS